MKFIIVLALLFCTLELSTGQERRFGRKVETLRLFGRAIKTATDICTDASKVGRTFCNDPDDPCASTGLVSCSRIADGFSIPCDTEPYCSTSNGDAHCSSELPSGCPAIPSNFQCTGLGYYPDPSNCRLFYNCYRNAAGSLIPESLFCDPGFVFDPNSATKMYCYGTTIASRCVTVTGCQNVQTTKSISIPYVGNSQFAALCVVGAPAPYIYQCPTGTTVNLNTIPPSCTYLCKAAGMFAHSLDNVLYFECKIDPSTNKLTQVATLHQCPTNQYFSVNKCIQKPL